jgi:hypothetical protein
MFSLFSFDRWFARNKQAPASAQIHIAVEEPIQIKEEELNKAVNSFLNDVKENTVTVNEELTNAEIDKLVQDVINEQQATTNALEVEVEEQIATTNAVEVEVEEQIATTNAVEVEVEEQIATTNAVEVEVEEQIATTNALEVEEQVTNKVEEVAEEVKLTIDIPKEEEVINVPKGKKGKKKNKNT